MNAKSKITIRYAKNSDRAIWLTLWADYCDHFKEQLGDNVTAFTWQRFFDENAPLSCLIAEDENGTPVGFATHFTHIGTWTTKDICYLEDLYVSPRARCMGVGQLLLERLVELGDEKGWYRIYWHTLADDNHAARALYDKFTSNSKMVCYRIAL